MEAEQMGAAASAVRHLVLRGRSRRCASRCRHRFPSRSTEHPLVHHPGWKTHGDQRVRTQETGARVERSRLPFRLQQHPRNDPGTGRANCATQRGDVVNVFDKAITVLEEKGWVQNASKTEEG